MKKINPSQTAIAITRRCILVFCFLFGVQQMYAKVYYVKHDATGDNNGTSWNDAFTNLQDAIDCTTCPDITEIWVAAGTYLPTKQVFYGIANYTDDRSKAFVMKSGIDIYGGFAGNEPPDYDLSMRDFVLNETILSGDLGTEGDNTDNSYNVIFNRGDNQTSISSAVLDGFTITGANADATPGLENSHGGGMYNKYCSSISIANCRFIDNSASRGGGMYNEYCSYMAISNCSFSSNLVTAAPGYGASRGGGIFTKDCTFMSIADCSFSSNSASMGGGMNNTNSSLSISDCSFFDNIGTSSGGGMYNTNSSPTVSGCSFSYNWSAYGGGMRNINDSNPELNDCKFLENQTSFFGGGIYNSSSSPSVMNCIFAGNSATFDGGGIYNFSSSSPTVTNSSFSGNLASRDGGGMYNSSSSPNIVNCSFSGNSASNRGGGVYNSGISSSFPLTVTNCILWGNHAPNGGSVFYNASSYPNISYSLVDAVDCNAVGTGTTCTEATMIYNQDPLFFIQPDYNNAPTTAGDLHLLSSSPARDAGTDADAPVTDYDGDIRPQGSGFDMGYDEYVPVAMEVFDEDNTPIVNGDATPSIEESTDFGNACVVGGSISFTYTIRNAGTADLTLDMVEISGGPAFSVAQQPISQVPGSGSTSFIITFEPAVSGLRSATVSIGNNDYFNNPYLFSVQGIGEAAQIWYVDTDGDTYGDPNNTTQACNQPAGFVADNTDCDDTDANVNPAAQEVCDGIDNDCDGLIDDADGSISGQSTWYADTDGDTYGDPNSTNQACNQPAGFVADNTDCDDMDANVNPAAQEVCDGIDNDCDGLIDDADGSVSGQSTWYADTDGDTYGDPNNTTQACNQPAGFVADNTDCDDTDGSVSGQSTWYADTDGDTYGDPNNTTQACNQPAGFVADNIDCDDTDANVNPAAQEVCDGIDNDCDGLIDDADGSVSGQSTWYADTDGDTYGDPNNTTQACNQPAGFVADNTDCDDMDANVNPAAQEVCDGIDNDCDGLIDDADGSVSGQSTWYADTDGDTYGDPNNTTQACNQPAGFVADNTDCDDTDANINPNAQEICDGIDNDCDGLTDDDDASASGQSTWYADADQDGFGDLNTTTMGCSQPNGFVADNSDCDDTDGNINPNAQEICDGIDNDCDGLTDDDDTGASGQSTWYADADQDGFGDPTNTITTVDCSQPSGFVADNTDCNDGNAAINPGATELCDGIDNNCDGTIDEINILYVRANATGANNGSSWIDAFPDLQDALNSSCPNITQIWVAAGTYKPTSGTDRTISFVMKNEVAIYGGFPNTGNPSYEDRNSNPKYNGTVLSGDLLENDGPDFTNYGDNSYHVVFNNNNRLDNTAVLDGFTITGGEANANNFPNTLGGGIFNNNSSPSISNCQFVDNSAVIGGGMCNQNSSSPSVTNCSFSGNKALYNGGGMLNLKRSSPSIVNCSFTGNLANSYGGGMYNFNSPLISVFNCIFSGNSASYGGGAMLNRKSSPNITNCSFSGNSATFGGGGMRNEIHSSPNLTNCILWGNGSEIVNFSGSNSTITYSIIQGGYPGEGNLSDNPDFVNPSMGNLRLQATSPAIDAGTNIGAPPNDLDGNPRPYNNGIVDMGAYEFQGNPLAPRITPPGGSVPVASTNSDISPAMSIYPNPATDQVAIRLEGLDEIPAKLMVYDQLGRVITSLDLAEGQDSVVLDLPDDRFSSGVYLISADVNGERLTRRLVITR